MKSRYWMDLTTADFARLPAGTVALLPVAAVEQHGPHMPVGTDTFINRGIVARALELVPPELPVLVLPEQAVGTSTEHLDYPGTLSHPAAFLMGLWHNVLASAARAGVQKLLVFNSHGGQIALLQPVALQLRRELDVVTAFASWFDAGLPDGLFAGDEADHGIHAGAIETSMVMHLRPETIDHTALMDFPSRAVDMRSRFARLAPDPGNGRLAGFGWKMQDLNPYGACGDASIATPEAGRRLVDHAATALAELLVELAGIEPGFLATRTFLDPPA
jgi:creatinine amidohydrolase